MTFNELSNEAKMLLIIGEPLRNASGLSVAAWLYLIWVEWATVTKKGREEFNAAFGEIDALVATAKRRAGASPKLASGAAITTNGEGGLQ